MLVALVLLVRLKGGIIFKFIASLLPFSHPNPRVPLSHCSSGAIMSSTRLRGAPLLYGGATDRLPFVL